MCEEPKPPFAALQLNAAEGLQDPVGSEARLKWAQCFSACGVFQVMIFGSLWEMHRKEQNVGSSILQTIVLDSAASTAAAPRQRFPCAFLLQ